MLNFWIKYRKGIANNLENWTINEMLSKNCIKISRDNDHKNKPNKTFAVLLFVFEVLKCNPNTKAKQIEKMLISKVIWFI